MLLARRSQRAGTFWAWVMAAGRSSYSCGPAGCRSEWGGREACRNAASVPRVALMQLQPSQRALEGVRGQGAGATGREAAGAGRQQGRPAGGRPASVLPSMSVIAIVSGLPGPAGTSAAWLAARQRCTSNSGARGLAQGARVQDPAAGAAGTGSSCMRSQNQAGGTRAPAVLGQRGPCSPGGPSECLCVTIHAAARLQRARRAAKPATELTVMSVTGTLWAGTQRTVDRLSASTGGTLSRLRPGRHSQNWNLNTVAHQSVRTLPLWGRRLPDRHWGRT